LLAPQNREVSTKIVEPVDERKNAKRENTPSERKQGGGGEERQERRQSAWLRNRWGKLTKKNIYSYQGAEIYVRSKAEKKPQSQRGKKTGSETRGAG